MQEKKRTVQDIRTELGDFLETVMRASDKTDRSLKRIDVVQAQPEIRKALEVIAGQILLIRQSLPRIYERTEELYISAITDGLTKLLNRGYFEDVIKPSIQQNPRAAVIMTDIDHFGKYNNTYGHQQGDTALRTVADAVRKYAKTALVARYGGEEFSIILAEYMNSKKDAQQTAEKIRKGVEETIIMPFSLETITEQATNIRLLQKRVRKFLEKQPSLAHYDETLDKYFSQQEALIGYIRGLQRIAISVGVAIRNKDESAEHLIYRADKALYCAKQEGRNRVVLADAKV